MMKMVNCKKHSPHDNILPNSRKNGGQRLINEMPIFRVKDAPHFDHENWRLIVNGLVKKSLRLSYDEILKLPKVHLTDDFTCVDGWKVKDVEWAGVRIKTIIGLAEPTPSARYAVFKAGGFTTTLALTEANRDEAILAHEHTGQPLTFEHGAPLRLIFPSQECFYSVKWVNVIELRAKYLEGTGKNIALTRIKPKTSPPNLKFKKT